MEKALLADLLPADQSGTGFGAFQTATGLAALVASPLMGLAVGWFGHPGALLGSAALAFLALAGLWAWGRKGAP